MNRKNKPTVFLIAVFFAANISAAVAQPGPEIDSGDGAQIRQGISVQPVRNQPDNTAGSPDSVHANKAGAKKDPKDDKGAVLKPGVIASVGQSAGSTAVNASTEGSTPGDDASAISASIKPGKRPGQCDAVVSNSSETDTYSVGYAVRAFDQGSGKTSNSQYFSASLPPKKSVVRTVTCKKGEGMQVMLKKGVRTAQKKKEGAADGGTADGKTPADSVKRPTS